MNALLTTLLAENKQTGGLASFIPLLLVMGVGFYLLTGSQRKQKKKQAEMMSSLKVGDDVITSGGIHGTVSYLEDTVAHVQVDTDVVIRVTKSALTRVSAPVDDDDETAEAEEVVADVTDADSTGDADDDAPTGAIVPKNGSSKKPSKS